MPIGPLTTSRPAAAMVATLASFLVLAIGPAASPALGHGDGFCGSHVTARDAMIVAARQRAGLYDPLMPPAGEFETVYVPLTIHVVRRSDGSGGLPEDRVQAAIEDANRHFAGAGIAFCRSGPTNFIDDDFFYEDIETIADIDLLRQTDVVEGTINCYFTEVLPGLCGISSFTTSPVQGIVMLNDCTATATDSSTFSHEIGHYFDLYHTHEPAFGLECVDGSNCTSAGDLLCDTPADPLLGFSNVSGCEYIGSARDSCNNEPYAPDPANIMSYSPQSCTDIFTPDQYARARATLENFRPELIDACPSGSVSRLSVNPSGEQGDGPSGMPAMSASGNVVAFQSDATNLVSDDTNGVRDVFVVDELTGSIERVSVSSAGAQGNAASAAPAIARDAENAVAFESEATNLVKGLTDSNGGLDVFLRDLVADETIAISVTPEGRTGNGPSRFAAISADGMTVAFQSDASDLVAGDTNGMSDIFVRDLASGGTTRVSVSSAGVQGNEGSFDPAISADGRYVAFHTFTDNFVDTDRNGVEDVYVHDTMTGETWLASRDDDGDSGNGGSCCPSFGGENGRWLVFQSSASDLVDGDTNGYADIFVHDLETGATILASLTADGGQPRDDSRSGRITPDGRFVIFESWARDIVDYDTNRASDVFVHDRDADRNTILDDTCEGCRTTRRVSLNASSTEADGSSFSPAISADGSMITYASDADDILGGGVDSNDARDVFLFERETDYTLTVTNLVAGETATFRVVAATAERIQALAYSRRGVGETYIGSLDVTLSLRRPTLVDTQNADADGNATFEVAVDERAGGLPIWFQVAESGRTTNVLAETVGTSE